MNTSTILAVFALVLGTVCLIHYGPRTAETLDRAIRALTHAAFGTGVRRW